MKYYLSLLLVLIPFNCFAGNFISIECLKACQTGNKSNLDISSISAKQIDINENAYGVWYIHVLSSLKSVAVDIPFNLTDELNSDAMFLLQASTSSGGAFDDIYKWQYGDTLPNEIFELGRRQYIKASINGGVEINSIRFHITTIPETNTFCLFLIGLIGTSNIRMRSNLKC